MSFLSAFNICASGLTAQRKRLDVASENIANIETTRTESGEPYRRKMVVLQEIGDNSSFRSHLAKASQLQNGNRGGVRVAEIVEDQRDLIPVYNPEHPDADEDGYVLRSNVNRMEEQFDLMSASNAYYANLTALEVVKAMTMKTLEIGK